MKIATKMNCSCYHSVTKSYSEEEYTWDESVEARIFWEIEEDDYSGLTCIMMVLPRHELNHPENVMMMVYHSTNSIAWRHGWQWHIGGMFCHSMKSITWRTPRSYHSTNSIAWRIFCHNAIPCHSTNSIAWRVMMVIQVYDRWKL